MPVRAVPAARLVRAAWFVAVVLSPSIVAAQYEASSTYYNGVSGTGSTLQASLKALMTSNGRTYTGYDDARDYLPFTDANPANLTQMFLVYDRSIVVNKGSVARQGFVGAYASREHVWPDSRQSVPNANGDIHMLRASDASGGLNNLRDNDFYGGPTLTGAARRINASAPYQFFAGDADKGDVARISFYAATTYGPTLTLVNGVDSVDTTQQMGDLNTLLHWHYLDTPDTFELRRNDVIFRGDDAATGGDDYTAWAGNNARNAYIDRPEYVWSVYADQQNDTKLTLAGGTVNANGGSTQTINLGRVLRNAAVPAGQAITLTKAGVDGTYYAVTAGGSATSTVGGRYNAFAMDTSGLTKSITLGLVTTTTAAGLKSGTVTIDNLDVTTEGGAGVGANDGNDVATINLSVLDASDSSFSNAGDANTLTLNFGTVAQNASAGLKSFTIFDLASSLVGADLTAMLDMDSITPAGDASTFSTSLATFANLAADGIGKSFTASFDTTALGAFTATYALGFSDENLPGTVGTTSLSLTLTGTVVLAPEPATLAAFAAVGLLPVVRRRRRRVA